jgi:hypothetical protein
MHIYLLSPRIHHRVLDLIKLVSRHQKSITWYCPSVSGSSQILNKNATSDAGACALPPPLVRLLPPFYILLLFLFAFSA